VKWLPTIIRPTGKPLTLPHGTCEAEAETSNEHGIGPCCDPPLAMHVCRAAHRRRIGVALKEWSARDHTAEFDLHRLVKARGAAARAVLRLGMIAP